MAAFSHQQHPLLLDSVFPPDSPLKNSGILDELVPYWTQFYPSSVHPPLAHLEGSSIDGSNQESSCIEQQSINNDPSTTQKQGNQSLLSMAYKAESGEQVFFMGSLNDQDVKQARGKKPKGDKEAKKGDRNDKKDQNKADVEEPPKGYIHVRARRGQATDSHSLAERVRREKISERMKMLQALVPGCDKVTGKALVLDEIINYVQSLQTQVEFLSMRLASLDPMVCNFGLMDLDLIMPFGTQGIINNGSMALPRPPIQSSSTATATATAAGIDTAPSTSLVDVTAIAASATNSYTALQPPNFVNTSVVPTTINTNTGVNMNQSLNFTNANTITTMATTSFPCPLIIDTSANLFQRGQKPSPSVLPLQIPNTSAARAGDKGNADTIPGRFLFPTQWGVECSY
ncbi:hypothetical protein Cgig2_005546 [Carnegiea gigantea]|uniref:BHLH domain-containing protein n=1 Tax=Carnegiea gigantea TaxID=171969 RepID=A0A9Q1KTS6_9CARY|nr:hypothetical protein Cgig2_005546 [Carnegiea gigantea]